MFKKTYSVCHMVENIKQVGTVEYYDAVTYRMTTYHLFGIPAYQKIQEINRERKSHGIKKR
jgi:hypothetical protein